MKGEECGYYLTNNGTNTIEVASNGDEFIIGRIMNSGTLRYNLQMRSRKKDDL